MLVPILKYIPSGLRVNKIYYRLYCAFFHFFYDSHRLKRFKDIHKNQRCFIIGNGPSILQQDLTKLKDEIVFVTNHFVLHPQYDEINPTYYCLENPDYFSGTSPDTRLYRLLLNKTGNAVKFFNLCLRPIINHSKPFAGHSVFYINLIGETRIYELGSMSLDITKGIYQSGTIIIDFCLPLAFYMGFSEIYLLGCDCDFNLDEVEDFSKAHFYEERMAAGLRPAGEYHKKHWYNQVTKAYSVAKEAFEKQGRKIYNAGVGGKLEVFERVNYDELF